MNSKLRSTNGKCDVDGNATQQRRGFAVGLASPEHVQNIQTVRGPVSDRGHDIADPNRQEQQVGPAQTRGIQQDPGLVAEHEQDEQKHDCPVDIQDGGAVLSGVMRPLPDSASRLVEPRR